MDGNNALLQGDRVMEAQHRAGLPGVRLGASELGDQPLPPPSS